jgi:hypothetical protein
MGILGRKAITIPLRVSIAIALAVASLLTAIAVLMTWGGSGLVGGKAVLTGAILVLPLVFAAKSDWPAGVAIALAFVTYFSVCFAALWFFTRGKRPPPAE